ncbi:hypothetical protein Back2_20010 [Nocardioides baekrokdamisoli]|uniref:Nucleotidyl transferase n=1 Tax=Nocardioides baekrokdamisoli TaxID=1804624 RepID=A0A3G9J2P1_9ACTN|nr:hypothetical protein [Nocardioides baekrokdamisoli]BBH17714.1 hypothetical protein Back2_20010 [Nocardioides baekrokdamisoli]
MSSPAGRHEFAVEEIGELLAELDRRLRTDGVAARVFIVGGAAVAMTGLVDGRRTLDVDGLSLQLQVYEIARQIAADRGLPPDWLNGDARMWVPSVPEVYAPAPDRPGLEVAYADDRFLFVTKVIAQRAKDHGDLIAAAARAGLATATAAEIEQIIWDYWRDDLGRLEFVITASATSVEDEVRYLARDAARALGRSDKG